MARLPNDQESFLQEGNMPNHTEGAWEMIPLTVEDSNALGPICGVDVPLYRHIPPTHLDRNAFKCDSYGRAVVRADTSAAQRQARGGRAPRVLGSTGSPSTVLHGRSLDAREILQDSL